MPVRGANRHTNRHNDSGDWPVWDYRDPVYPMTYFVAAGDFVKIGTTKDPLARLRNLQGGSPFPFELICLTEEVTEEDAHREWHRLRVRGEWFERTPELECWAAMRDQATRWARTRERMRALQEEFPVLRRPIHWGFIIGERAAP